MIKLRLEDARAFVQAFTCAVRVVYPHLPPGSMRMAILDDGAICTIDDPCYVPIDRVNPLEVLRKEGCKVFLARLGLPLLRWVDVAVGAARVYRRIKRNRAGEAAGKGGFPNMGAHAASLPSPDKVNKEKA